MNSIGSFATGLESAGVLRPESLIERLSADSVLLRQSRSGLSQGLDDAFLGCDSSSRADNGRDDGSANWPGEERLGAIQRAGRCLRAPSNKAAGECSRS